MDVMNKIGILILAAGAATRLGLPKQLLKFKGKTFISKNIETALSTNAENICVVLGSNAEAIQNEIKDFPVEIYFNEKWQSGMGSSIRFGLECLLNMNSDLSAIIVMLCDQPLIESKHINLLIEKFEQTKKPIIASTYKNTNGVPALFSKEIFAELLKIKGDKGAKKLIKSFPELVATVEMPEAEFDIDTPKDLHKLKEFE